MICKDEIIRRTRNSYTRGLSRNYKCLVTILIIFCFTDSESVYSQKRMISVEDAKIVLRRTIIELGGSDSTMDYSIIPIPMTYRELLKISGGKHSVPHDIASPKKSVGKRIMFVGFASPKVSGVWMDVGRCVAYIDAYNAKVLYFFEEPLSLPQKWKPCENR